LNRGQNIKYLPYVFTEEGVAMLSSVLKSERAIQVNIQIMRTFSKIREMISSNKELREKIEKLEKKYEGHDKKFAAVFDAMRDLFTEKAKPKNEIGFNTK
jgi:predicted transcriptional regulator